MARTPVPSSSTSDIRISSTPPSILNSLPIASTTSGRTETVIAEPSGMDGIFWGLGLHPLLAEPGHRPVEVMQVDLVHAADGVGGPPLLRGAIRTRIHDPMEDGQEDGALDRKFKLAIGQEVFDHRSERAVPPEPLEQQ